MSKTGKNDTTELENSLTTPEPSAAPVKTNAMVIGDHEALGNALKEVGAVNVFVANDKALLSYLQAMGYPPVKKAADADVCIGAVAYDELAVGTYCITNEPNPVGFNLVRSHESFKVYRKVR